MKRKWIEAHMRCALVYAQCSDAVRLQVGCIVVQGNQVVSIGINGTPPGYHTNVCEIVDDYGELVTRPQVIHAERNAFLKLAREPGICKGASLFVTHSPCPLCADLIIKHGIQEVFYAIEFRDPAGLQKLRDAGIHVQHVPTVELARPGAAADQPVDRARTVHLAHAA
jgi:dCMP deaminase